MYCEHRAVKISRLRTVLSILMPTPFPMLRLFICNVISLSKIWNSHMLPLQKQIAFQVIRLSTTPIQSKFKSSYNSYCAYLVSWFFFQYLWDLKLMLKILSCPDKKVKNDIPVKFNEVTVFFSRCYTNYDLQNCIQCDRIRSYLIKTHDLSLQSIVMN